MTRASKKTAKDLRKATKRDHVVKVIRKQLKKMPSGNAKTDLEIIEAALKSGEISSAEGCSVVDGKVTDRFFFEEDL